jgi:hypothetical protein
MAGLGLLFTGEAQAQLVRESPFQSRAPGAAMETAKLPLEFCGYIQTADGLQFRVRDPEKKRAAFVRLNVPETELGIVARRHDAEGEALIVEYEGRTLTLPQQTAKVRSAPAGMAPVPQGGARPIPITLPTVRPAANDRDRLEAIRADLIRRQEERAKAEKNAPAKAPSTR